MKKTLVLLALLFTIASVSFAQLSITTNFRQDATWDKSAEKWNVSSTDTNGTRLDFDKGLKNFKHTTKTITSNYQILDWNYNDTTTMYTMQVKSDAGNTYEMLIDGKNNCVCFFYYNSNNVYTLVRHTIKDSYFKEDKN